MIWRARKKKESVPPPVGRARQASGTIRRSPVAERKYGAALIDAIVEDSAELALVSRGVGTAQRCIEIMMRHLPCRSGIVRHGNARRANHLVVAAVGDASHLIMLRHRRIGPMLEGDVLAVPILFGGAHLGAIELSDPADGNAFEPSDEEALMIMAERYAPHIVMGGFVTDATAISRYAAEERAWSKLPLERIRLKR